jgi:integrase
LLLLGARRQEAGGLLSEVDLDRGSLTIGGERTKNHRALTLALPPAALAILASVPRRGEFVFGGNRGFASWSALKAQIDAGSGVREWRLHDTRRTVATHMAELGIAPHVIEEILNHQSGHKRGVAGTYNRAGYEPQKRHALNAWADHLLAIVEGRATATTVVPLRG